jgi:hypothetical protein
MRKAMPGCTRSSTILGARWKGLGCDVAAPRSRCHRACARSTSAALPGAAVLALASTSALSCSASTAFHCFHVASQRASRRRWTVISSGSWRQYRFRVLETGPGASRHRSQAGELGTYRRRLRAYAPSLDGHPMFEKVADKIGPLRPWICRLSTSVVRPPGRTGGLRRGDDNTGMACRTGRTPCSFVGISNYFFEIPQEGLSSHRALHQYAGFATFSSPANPRTVCASPSK